MTGRTQRLLTHTPIAFIAIPAWLGFMLLHEAVTAVMESVVYMAWLRPRHVIAVASLLGLAVIAIGVLFATHV